MATFDWGKASDDQNAFEHLMAHWLKLKTTQAARHLIKSRLQDKQQIITALTARVEALEAK